MVARFLKFGFLVVISAAFVSALPAATRYSGHGLILSIQPEKKTLTISHGPIKGYMPAMIMPFTVKDPELLAPLQPGQQVYFRLVVEARNSYLDHIRITSASPVEPEKWQSPVLSHLVQVGEALPDFQLTDHRGQVLSLTDFRGKLVVVTFIYTRCPLPDYCPRMTDNFAEIKNRFKVYMGKDLILLSITIDPQYDTPEILRTYARVFSDDVPGWYYLTGQKRDIQKVAGYFGLEFWPDEGQILHNLQTAVIDRSGRMAANIEGKEYSPRQLGDFIENLLRNR